ncbi:MAG: hypothetical protein RL701_307 [Pseudomonadota bacterium]
MWRRRKRRRLFVIFMLACAALPLALYAWVASGADFFGTIRIGGVAVTRNAAGVAALTEHADKWQQEIVTIRVGPYVARYPRTSLGAQLRVEPVKASLLALGRSGNPLRDFSDIWTSRRKGLDLPWHPDVAQTELSLRIREMRYRLERPPVAGLFLADGTELPGTPGLTINLLGAVERISRSLVNGEREAQLDVVRVKALRSKRYANGHYEPGQFTQVLSEFVTKYRTYGPAVGRARNIELAAQAIDGAVLEPGGELSFNDKVGQRSYERGYEVALELSNRRVVKGIGGGVCQVAATLHAASFLAGFALPVYRPHSRPAKYIDLGLDTMVSWPQQDMRIANVYPFPVRIRVQAQQGQLIVRLEGAGKAHPVEWSTEILQRIKPSVQHLPDAALSPGTTKVVQEAIDGLVVRRKRVIYLPSGPRVEEALLRYPPNDRIVAVGGGARVGHTAIASATATQGLDMEDF